MDKTYIMNIDFSDYSSNRDALLKNIYFNEQDTETAFIEANLVNNKDILDLTTVDKVVANIRKNDDTKVVSDCTILDAKNGKIKIPFSPQALKMMGVNQFQIMVTKGLQQLNSPKFYYNVDEALVSDDDIQSSNEFSLLTDLIAKTEKLQTDSIKIKEDVVKLDTEVTNNESTRQSNEVIRVSNEDTRKTQETTRQESVTKMRKDVDDKLAEIATAKDGLTTTVNDKITEINTTTTDNTKKIDDKIVDIQTQLDKKVTDKFVEVDTTTGTKMTEVETRMKSIEDEFGTLVDGTGFARKTYVDDEIKRLQNSPLIEFETLTSLNVDNTVDGFVRNLEIKGNTVQSTTNLADIKSVGDKAEGQELYKINLTSCGKNLLGEMEHGTYNPTDGLKLESSGEIRNKKPIKINPTVRYIINTKSTTGNIRIYMYNYKMDYIRSDVITNKMTIRVSEDTSYINIRMVDTNLEVETQLEEGLIATQYEPHEEHKLTILSPCQIEKVGTVSDSIVEKDRVWGVEKNNDSISIDSLFKTTNNIAINGSFLTLSVAYSSLNIDNSFTESADCITTFGERLNSTTWNNPTKEGIYIGKTAIGLVAEVSKVGGNTKDMLEKYISNKGYYVKRSVSNPKFIPLPNDQQIALRTFANKTNILFDTEIEGSITGDFPKSIGATLSTHSSQIDNINEDLQRVKKLEEATTTTISTESNFVNIEETSNGYLTDIKLEGKTLNNYSGVKNGEYIVDRFASSAVVINRNEEVVGKKVRLYFLCKDIKAEGNIGLMYCVQYNDGTQDSYIAFQNGMTSGEKILDIEWKNNISKILVFLHGSAINDSKATLTNFILSKSEELEFINGYFEGIKSVGEGTDEIVVKSVDASGNLFDGILEDGSVSWINGSEDTDITRKRSKFIKAKKQGEFLFSSSKSGLVPIKGIAFYDINKKLINSQTDKNNFSVPNDCEYIRIVLVKDSEYDICISYNQKYTQYKEDKKQLLFLKDGKWSKPVLREFDTIELHSDGKYYYHVRSYEKIINGNERINLTSINNDTIRFLFYATDNNFNAKTNSLGVCDKLNYISFDSSDKEHIRFDSGSPSNLILWINKNKLETPDVVGLKKWLQLNNFTVVYELEKEEVYECTPIDVASYENETNYSISTGFISPTTTIKTNNYIGNVITKLREKVDALEDLNQRQSSVSLAIALNVEQNSLDIEKAFQRGNDVKKLLVDELISVGSTASTTDTFEVLIDGISNISTGKKWVSGKVTSTANYKEFTSTSEINENSLYTTISNLSFVPSIIILYYKNGLGSFYNSYFNKEFVMSSSSGELNSSSSYKVNGNILNGNIYNIPVKKENVEYEWIAYE